MRGGIERMVACGKTRAHGTAVRTEAVGLGPLGLINTPRLSWRDRYQHATD
jgi:hypothetical protein